MATSEKDELRKIAEADDLHISPFHDDGKTYGTPTWIWSVAVGMTKDVSFEPVGGTLNDRIDDVHRSQYASGPYLKPMISAGARDATVRVVPT